MVAVMGWREPELAAATARRMRRAVDASTRSPRRRRPQLVAVGRVAEAFGSLVNSGAKFLRASGSVRKSCAGAALPGTVGDGRTEGATCVRACGTLEGADATVPKSALMIARMVFEIVTRAPYCIYISYLQQEIEMSQPLTQRAS